jgi:hypothetical protein
MDILGRVKAILVAPETEWPAIEREPETPASLLGNYVVYLAAIPPVAGFFGGSVIGVSAGAAGTMRTPLFIGLLGAVISYVLSFVVVYAIATVIEQLAPRFGSVKEFPSALKVTVYSLTPLWVAGVFQLVAGLRFVGYVVAFFGIYLAWLGLPRLMKTPRDDALPYVAAAGACAIAIVVAVKLFEAAFLG